MNPIKKLYSYFLKPKLRYGFLRSIHNILNYSDREVMIKMAMEFSRDTKLNGDYLEFGVRAGRSFIHAYHFAKISGLENMRFHAFDSFKGLPEITGNDAKGFSPYYKGQFSCDVETFLNNISENNVDLNKVETISGYYDRSLKRKYKIKTAAVIWIDCDLYESTVLVLDFIKQYIKAGTVLIFDDWFLYKGNPLKGEQAAFSNWLMKNKSIKVTEFYRFGWHGNSFIVNKI